MKLDLALMTEFSEDLKSQGRSQATIESYRRDAQQFVEFITKCEIQDHVFDPTTLVQFQQYQIVDKKASANTLRRSTISIRQFFRFLAQKENMSGSPYDFVAIPEREESIPPQEVIDKVKKAVEQSITYSASLMQSRNAAILALLGLEGLKTSELIALTWGDFIARDPVPTLHIKGGRKRTIEIAPESHEAITRYKDHLLAQANLVESTKNAHNMFIAFKGRDGSVALPNMTRHGLKFVLYEIGESHHIDHLNAELLRHVAISHLLTEGRGPQEVMNHLGLKRMGIIRKYTRLNRFAPDPAETDHYSL